MRAAEKSGKTLNRLTPRALFLWDPQGATQAGADSLPPFVWKVTQAASIGLLPIA